MANAALEIREELNTVEDTSAALEVTTAVTDDDVDALFAELEEELQINGDQGDEVVLVDEDDEADLLEAGAIAEVAELKREAMEEMDEASTVTPDDSGMAQGAESIQPKSVSEIVDGLVAEKEAEKVKTRKAPATKRISTAGMMKSDAIKRALGSKAMDYTLFENSELLGDDAEIEARSEANMKMIDTLPIKIGEKATNLLGHLHSGAALSNYTVMALEILFKTGELSSKTLKDAYIARPYSVGTANSQATQLMKLLPSLKIAVKSGGVLKVNPDSTLAPMLQAKFA